MFRKSSIIFTLIFCYAFVFEANAQSILKDGKIPKDFVLKITYEFAGHRNDQYTINSNGKVFYEKPISMLPKVPHYNAVLNLPSSKTIKINPPKKTKPKPLKLKKSFSKNKLKEIIKELEESKLFELDGFGDTDSFIKNGSCTNPAESKRITISTNGKTQTVGFYLSSCETTKNAEKETFLSIYNKIVKELEGVEKEIIKNEPLNNEISKDLMITLEEKGRFKYEIRLDGSVTYYPISVTTMIIDGVEINGFLVTENGELKPIKNQIPEKKTKLSEKQLNELILEFEKINFFSLSNSYLRADNVCDGDYYVSGPKVLTNLSIQNAGLNKSIVFENSCNSDATAKLKTLSNKIIKTVNTIEFKTDNSLNLNKN